MYKISEISEEIVGKVKALESEMDVHIMAIEPGLEYAELSDEQIQKVQVLEGESSKTLLVYKN